MDVGFNHKEIKRGIFGKILVGEVFLIEEGEKIIAFLRTTCNAVNLETGELEEFSFHEPIIFPEKVEFTITY